MKLIILLILLGCAGCCSTTEEAEPADYHFLPFECDEFPNTAQKNPNPQEWGEDFCGV
jgi:hypothetical protein